jgi:hypothetical protein
MLRTGSLGVSHDPAINVHRDLLSGSGTETCSEEMRKLVDDLIATGMRVVRPPVGDDLAVDQCTALTVEKLVASTLPVNGRGKFEQPHSRCCG